MSLNKALRQSMKKTLWSVLTAVLMCLLSCTVNNGSDEDYNTWTLSGYVINGHDKSRISSVSIFYLDKNGTEIVTKTGTNGEFYISKLPLGERKFRFAFVDSLSTVKYTERIISATGSGSAVSEGTLADVSRTVSLFPLTASFSGKLKAEVHGSGQNIDAANILVRLSFKDTGLVNSTPAIFEDTTNAAGEFSFSNVPVGEKGELNVPNFEYKGIMYSLGAYSLPALFDNKSIDVGDIKMEPKDTTIKVIDVVKSNVISQDGFGLTGVPINITPWYILNVKPSTDIEATITGGGEPKTIVRISGDTIFVDPVRDFTYGAMITIRLTGTTTTGDRILLDIDGARQFKTKQSVFPIASNTWDQNGNSISDFGLYDTMWVAFSESLSTDLSTITWEKSDANKSIYGSGVDVNSTIWVKRDTLFVLPDQRLAIDFGESVGFKITVTAASGKKSEAINYMATLIQNDYSVKWTNTKDQFGNMRDDFKLIGEPIVIVSNISLKEVYGISDVEGAAPPPDMNLSNITIKKDVTSNGYDTIVYIPTLRMKSNTEYGMDFDVMFHNGIKRNNVLAVKWKTLSGVRIVSVDNKEGGNYKKFPVLNGKLTVAFSDTVDTSPTAPVPFKIHLRDVNGIPVRSTVQWDGSFTKATISIVDTLPTADYDASPAYTEDAVNTRAVNTVSFDLSTKSGEQVFQLTPPNGNIEIHTEKGLCLINSNIIKSHDPSEEVDINENPVGVFPVDQAVTLTFSRALDITHINKYGADQFFGIEEKQSGLNIPCVISFSTNSITATVKPKDPLKVGTSYYVWVKDTPADSISGAGAINKHSGVYSGRDEKNRILKEAFRTKAPDISYLEGQILADSNTVAGVTEGRVGVSAGFTYSHVVGVSNVMVDRSAKFRVDEVAWNNNHSDSVHGYQVQVQKVDRSNTATSWYDYKNTVETSKWTSTNQHLDKRHSVEIKFTTLYNLFATEDPDGSGRFYTNSTNLFNDSARINVRIRPFVGEGDPGRNEVGKWSNVISIVDNVAPCDSDFVTAENCDQISVGGVRISDNVNFDNASGTTANDNGYIKVLFPEDMDPSGPAPKINFYYGPYGDSASTFPTEALSVVSEGGGKTRWVSAREYRIYVSVPVFDYTDNLGSKGAYYSVNVAGCRDISGNVIQTYGTDGSLANSDITAMGRKTRIEAAAEQKQGSSSVTSGFIKCSR